MSFTLPPTLTPLPPSLPPSLPSAQSSGKDQHKLIIIATTGFSDEVLERTGIRGAFNTCIEVPYLTTVGELMFVLRGDSEEKEQSSSLYSFTPKQLRELEQKLKSVRFVGRVAVLLLASFPGFIYLGGSLFNAATMTSLNL